MSFTKPAEIGANSEIRETQRPANNDPQPVFIPKRTGLFAGSYDFRSARSQARKNPSPVGCRTP